MHRLLATLPFWILALGIPGGASAERYAPQVGQRHPDVLLPRIDGGRPISLAQFRGKKVLLMQFASW